LPLRTPRDLVSLSGGGDLLVSTENLGRYSGVSDGVQLTTKVLTTCAYRLVPLSAYLLQLLPRRGLHLLV
jgi:hypothetical protein